MRLTKLQINKFQALYKARFNKDITYGAAELEAVQLIRLVSSIQPSNSRYMKMDMEISGDTTKPDHAPLGAGNGVHRRR
jgi:hypothetical protein